MQPFAEKWAEEFSATHPGASIRVQGGGSTAGIAAALTGAAQIGMSSRALRADEASQLSATLVARDGIALVIHPTNRLDDLSLEQLRRVYSGAIDNWQAVGGPDAPITLITREEGSGTRAAFEQLVMAGVAIARGALVEDSTGTVRQLVASDPAAIGYISLGIVDDTVKALRLDGVAPSEASIDAGSYALVRPFLFLTRPDPDTRTQRFIDWIMSPSGRALTRHEGLLPPSS